MPSHSDFATSRKKLRALAGAMLCLSGFHGNLFGYGAEYDHPAMTSAAIAQLNKASANYIETQDPNYEREMLRGCTDEDYKWPGHFDPGFRGPMHFFNPRTGYGLSTYVSAGILLPTQQSAIMTAIPSWDAALLNYQTGDKLTGYYNLGKVLHLVTQDMAQPSHTCDDPHMPWFLTGDDTTIENQDSRVTVAAGRASAHPLQIKGHRSPADFALDMSARSSSLATHKGSGIPRGIPPTGQPAGQITIDANHIEVATYAPGTQFSIYPNEWMDNWWFYSFNGDKLYYHPSIPGDVGAGFPGQVFGNDWWHMPNGNNDFYIDKFSEIRMYGMPADDYFIQQLVPQAVDLGAELLKLFYDLVNPPPYVTEVRISGSVDGPLYTAQVQDLGISRKINVVGKPAPIVTYKQTISVEVDFSKDVTKPAVTLNQIQLKGTLSGSNPMTWRGTIALSQLVTQAQLSSSGMRLPLSVTALDQSLSHLTPAVDSQVDSNPSTVALRDSSLAWKDFEAGPDLNHYAILDTAGPLIELWKYQPPSPPYTPDSSNLRVELTDNGSGVDHFEIVDMNGKVLRTKQATNSGDTVYGADVPAAGSLANGQYQVSAYDVIGFNTLMPFVVCDDPNQCDECKSPNPPAYCQDPCLKPNPPKSCDRDTPNCSPTDAITVMPGFSCHGDVDIQICPQSCPGTVEYINGEGIPDGQCKVIHAHNVGSAGVPVTICYDAGLLHCTVIDASLGVCRGDPTFVGGNLTDQPLPSIHPVPPPAFSPALPNSPRPQFLGTFTVPGSSASVTILISDAGDVLRRTVVANQLFPPGKNTFGWDGKDDTGTLLPEGLYHYRITQSDILDPNRVSTEKGDVAIDNTLPVAQITSLSVSNSVLDHLIVTGTATDIYLVNFKMEVSSGSGGASTLLYTSPLPITNGIVGSIDSSAMPDGTYQLQLTATDSAGLTTTATKPVIVSHATGAGIRILLDVPTQAPLNVGFSSTTIDNPATFIDEGLPSGGGAGQFATVFNWSASSARQISGNTVHTDTFADAFGGPRVHYLIHAQPGYSIAAGDNLIQYVYLDPANAPSEIMLGFYTGKGTVERRAYWGSNDIDLPATPGTPELLSMGPLPPTGQWIRLKIPASVLGLDGQTLTGAVFAAHGGRAFWDKTTTSNQTLDSQTVSALPIGQGPSIPQTVTTLNYSMTKAATLQIGVHEKATGTLVKSLVNAPLLAGQHSVSWDQTDSVGRIVNEGDYFFRVTSPDGPIDSEAIVLQGTTTFSGSTAPQVVDADLNLYSLDLSGPRIVKTTSQGYGLSVFGFGELNQPSGLVLEANGNLIVQEPLGFKRYEVGRRDFSANSLTGIIQVPWDNALVKATVPIIGKVYGRDFSFYKVELGKTWTPSSFTELNKGYSPVTDFPFPDGSGTIYGNLATWETGLVPGQEFPLQDLFHPPVDLGYRGRWTLRLTVENNSGQQVVTEKRVLIGRVINNATGGEIVSEDGNAGIKVPPLSLANAWDIFGLVTATSTPPGKMPNLPTDLISVSPMYQLIPGAYRFSKPVEFEIGLSTTVPYPPSAIGLYEYNANTGAWDPVQIQRRPVRDASGTWVGTLFVDPQLVKIPTVDGFYGLFTSTRVPPAPQLDPVPTPTLKRSILISGQAGPFSQVNLVLQQAPTTFTTAPIAATYAGLFASNLALPLPGHYQLAATAIDLFGHASPLSNSISFDVLATSPAWITSLRFTDAQYTSSGSSVTLTRGGEFYLEMQASDIDPAQQDIVYAVVRSSVTDPAGIVLPLTQVDPVSPLYRALGHLGAISDPARGVLAAAVTGELIRAEAEANPTIADTLMLTDAISDIAPYVYSFTHPSALQDTFEDVTNQWAPYNRYTGATLSIDTAAASGIYSMKIEQTLPNGDFSATVYPSAFDATQYPRVSFDYQLEAGKIPPFSLFFQYHGAFHEVALAAQPVDMLPNFVSLADLRSQVVADGGWHSLDINLLSYLKNLYPNQTDYTVDKVILGAWRADQYLGVVAAPAPIGSYARIDNFRIWSGGVADSDPVMQWTIGLSKAASYRYAFDQSPGTTPNGATQTTAKRISASGLSDGDYFFHVSAQNALGTWGQTNHYRFAIDRTAPQLSNPIPPNQLPLVRSPLTQASFHVQDASGIDLSSLAFTVNGHAYTGTHGITYDLATGTITINLSGLQPPLFLSDGDVISVSVTGLSDFAGNQLTQPFNFSWQFVMSGNGSGQFGPITINGGQDPDWSRDNQHLAFSSQRNGNFDLFVLNAQSTGTFVENAANLRQLTSSPANETEPAWSPDGSQIVFVSDIGGYPQLWIIPSDGSAAARPLTSSALSDRHPTWRADGRQVLFSRSSMGLGNLWAVDIDPQTWSAISESALTADTVGYNLEPRFSSDGLSVVFRRSLYQDNIVSMQANGSGLRAVTNSGTDTDPALSPDNKLLAFSSKRSSTVPALWLSDAGGQNPALLLDNLGLYSETQATWNPDGSRLAFTTTRSGAPNIWQLNTLNVANFSALPSPFAPGSQTPTALKTITFSYDVSGSNAFATLEVYNAQRALVRTLYQNLPISGGMQHFTWDGLDLNGHPLMDGGYFARVSVNGGPGATPVVLQALFQIDNLPPTITVRTSSGNVPRGTFNPNSQFSITAVDLSSVSSLEVAVDSATSFTPYVGPFSLAAGPHTLYLRATDAAGNITPTVVQPANIDDQPPTISVTYPQGVFQGVTGIVYLSSSVSLSASAADSTASVVVSGLETLSSAIDALAPTIVFASSITVPPFPQVEGAHLLTISAADLAGNSASLSKNCFLDLTEPQVSLQASPALHNSGARLYAQPGTALNFIGLDPVSQGDASGFDSVYLAVNGGAFQRFVTPYVLTSSGVTSLSYFSTDRVGNASLVTVQSITVSSTIPSAILTLNPSAFSAGGTDFASANTTFSLSVARGSPSPDYFEMVVDSNATQILMPGDFITLSQEGPHALTYRAVFGGVPDVSETYLVTLDTTPPVSTLSIPSGSSGTFLNPTAVISMSSTDLLAGGQSVQVSIDGVNFAYRGPFTVVGQTGLSAGSHVLSWSAIDGVGNREAPQSLRFTLDDAPPTLAINPIGGKQYGVYASGDSDFELIADDGSGVGGSNIFVDSGGGSFIPYVSPIRYAVQSIHLLRGFAKDAVGNLSATLAQYVYTDLFGPTVNLLVSGPIYTSSGTSYVTAQTQLNLKAGKDTMSGTRGVEAFLDGQSVSLPFSLTAIGLHSFIGNAFDYVDNRSSDPVHLALVLDATPPVTSLVHSTGTPVSTSTFLSLQATDPLTSGYASGVALTYLALDGQPFAVYGQPFVFTSTGSHHMAWYSVDHLGNTEPVNSLTLNVVPGITPPPVDTTPPVTTLSLSSTTISTSTPIGFSAIDPLVSGLASGVATTYFNINSAPFAVYISSFVIPSSGTYTLAWYSEDYAGNIEVVRSTTVVVVASTGTVNPPPPPLDKTPPVTTLSLSSMAISTSTPIGFTAIDPLVNGFASGVATTYFTINSAPYSVYMSSFVIPSSGTYTLGWYSVDFAGNVEVALSTAVIVVSSTGTVNPPPLDTTPPVTTLLLSSMTISTSTPIGISAQDPLVNGFASGVATTYFNIGAGSFVVYTSSFVIPSSGTYSLSWFSIDHAGNIEVAQSTTLVVLISTGPVNPPPPPPPSGLQMSLLSPSPYAKEMEAVFSQRRISVIGSAGGTGFAYYRLQFAPGQNPPAGFQTIAISTVSVSTSTLGVWDARKLFGFYTLRLEVSVSTSVLVSTAAVYIGPPNLLATFQNKGDRRILSNPQAIAVDPQFQMFVANAGSNEIVKLDASGALLGRFKGNGFSGPTGIAVDLAGNLYVADRGNDRVVIMDYAGQVIRSIGKIDSLGQPQPGSGPGEFSSPNGLAVSNTRLVVADKGNGRLQVFDPNGTFLFEIRPSSSSIRPFAVALDAVGNIYTTDEMNNRMVAFASDGTYLYSAGTTGREGGGFRQPQGMAVGALGSVFVVDRQNNLVQRVNPFQQFVSVFGTKFGLAFPVGAAIDSTGRLLVTDTQKNRILRFGITPGFTQTGLLFTEDPQNLMSAPDSLPTVHGARSTDPRAPGAADSSFALREIFVYPNPAKNGAVPTLHIETGIADRVQVKIYDLAGHLKVDTTLTGSPSLIDSGNGLQYAYEWAWTDHIASGVYFYQVETHSGGQTLKARGKFAVIR